MLNCDGCDAYSHLRCLNLKGWTKADWYCNRCLVGFGEYGFEEGGDYSLQQFQQKAASLKARYFKKRNKTVNEVDRHAAENVVEQEFWRAVLDVDDPVSVEYGADIHCTTHGSGFPHIESDPLNPYSSDPWNLNILPVSKGSLLRHIKADVSGMTVPWLYVGMCFSTFCWHAEDHYAYSINYQHFGETKTWYGVPGRQTAEFEAAIRKAVPELFEIQPDLLFQLVTMLSPNRLVSEGVDVYAVDQRANQFVITFPSAYHAGFNHGFNLNEAVNFAPFDWEPFGRQCIQRYIDYSKQPVFSHDELLITTLTHDDSVACARNLRSAIVALAENEFEARLNAKGYIEEEGEAEITADENNPCVVCKCSNFLSYWRCGVTGKTACSAHVDSFCDCDASIEKRIHKFHFNTTTTDLQKLVNSTIDKADQPKDWQDKYHLYLYSETPPTLRMLRSLLTEGERIQYSMPELPALRQFVEVATVWQEEANTLVARKHKDRKKNETAWRRGTRNAAELANRDLMHRDASYLLRLANRAKSMNFSCPEIQLLEERFEAILEYQERVRTALKRMPNITEEEISELIDSGEQFNVDLEELDLLEKCASQLTWLYQVREVSDQVADLETTSELIKDGFSFGISEANTHMQNLLQKREIGLAWSGKVENLLEKHATIPHLRMVMDEAPQHSLHRKVMKVLEDHIRQSETMYANCNSLYQRCISTNRDDHPTPEEIEDVRALSLHLRRHPPELSSLVKMYDSYQAWTKTGKRMFGKANAPVTLLQSHLLYVENRNERCFSLTDLPKGTTSRPFSAPETPAEVSHKALAEVEMPTLVPAKAEPSTPMEGIIQDNSAIERESKSPDGTKKVRKDLFCICRMPESGLMVECEVCHEWYVWESF